MRVVKSVNDMGRRSAPLFGKCHHRGWRQRLVFQHNEAMPVQSIGQPLTLMGVQGFGNIQPINTGSQNITEWNNIGHIFT